MAILYAYHSSQIDVDQVNQHINALLRVPTTAFPSLPLPPAFPDLPPFLFSSWPLAELPIIAGQLQAVPAAPALEQSRVPPPLLYILVAT